MYHHPYSNRKVMMVMVHINDGEGGAAITGPGLGWLRFWGECAQLPWDQNPCTLSTAKCAIQCNNTCLTYHVKKHSNSTFLIATQWNAHIISEETMCIFRRAQLVGKEYDAEALAAV